MRTKHFSRLFLFDSDHGNQSLSLPLTFLLCSELNNCIIADFTGQLFSLPSPSPLPVLNPLHYSHVSAFNPRAPSCHSFLSSVLFVFSHSFVLHSTPLSPSTPLLLSVSRRLLCKASSTPTRPSLVFPHSPSWFIKALRAWTHTRRWMASWSISDLATFTHAMQYLIVYLLSFYSTPLSDQETIFFCSRQNSVICLS